MNEVEILKSRIEELNKIIEDLVFRVNTLEDDSLKTSKRQIINKEVQFMQKCYRANGTLITQINT